MTGHIKKCIMLNLEKHINMCYNEIICVGAIYNRYNTKIQYMYLRYVISMYLNMIWHKYF